MDTFSTFFMNTQTVNPVYMDYGLIVLNVMPLVVFVVNVVRLIKGDRRNQRKSSSSSMAVMPIDNKKRKGKNLKLKVAPISDVDKRAVQAWEVKDNDAASLGN